MRILRPTTIIAAFLIVAISIPPPLFSQTAPKQPKRSQRSDALAPAINELLKLDPLAPESADGKDSENADAQSKEESKPPADDAPISELLDYWQTHAATSPKPSDKVRQRLLEACEDRPESLPGLMDLLPETTDTHDRLYKLLQEEPDDSSWKSDLRNWLQRNSGYFRSDLIAEARGEGMGENSQKDNLIALARLDWETAKPIVEALAAAWNKEMTPIALSLLYGQAQQDGDSAQTEKYRALLKAIVVNRQSPQDARQTALLNLAGAEWNGQEDWVVSLFADPTLSGLKEGAGSEEKSKNADIGVDIGVSLNILFILPAVDPERWFPVISALVGGHQRTVHLSAVKCLADHMYRESTDEKWKKKIAQTLAPWLTDPDWAAAEDRFSFIKSLNDAQTPELIPELIWVLEHDEDPDNRAAAAEALTQYSDRRANPALRQALEKEEDETLRNSIVTALAQCGGFSDDEMAEAVEAYAKMIVTEAGKVEIEQAESEALEKPLQLKVSIGRILSESETIEATEGLALRLIERAKSLRASQPAVARQILRSIEGAPLRVVEINLVERIGAGWGDIDALKLALENRDSLRKSAGDELYSLIKQGGYAAGVAAAILKDEREHRETLAGTDTKAQLALLAGARYLRDKLPVELAGKLLNSANHALAKAAAKAAESYLEVEDSAEARKLVLAQHRGEARILGDIAT
ncbi:MAG TPA: HEAT repeat domain-containing protein, partial [Blastocatellia bacterium]